MGTRAIIGIEGQDGSILGAWNWNDGFQIKETLMRNFKSLEDIRLLLQLGMFSVIYSKKEYEDYINWLKTEHMSIQDKTFTPHKNAVILQDQHHLNRPAERYADIEDVMNQDVNVAYIFKNGKWQIHSDCYFSKQGRSI